jgi:hypothetical protein
VRGGGTATLGPRQHRVSTRAASELTSLDVANFKLLCSRQVDETERLAEARRNASRATAQIDQRQAHLADEQIRLDEEYGRLKERCSPYSSETLPSELVKAVHAYHARKTSYERDRSSFVQRQREHESQLARLARAEAKHQERGQLLAAEQRRRNRAPSGTPLNSAVTNPQARASRQTAREQLSARQGAADERDRMRGQRQHNTATLGTFQPEMEARRSQRAEAVATATTVEQPSRLIHGEPTAREREQATFYEAKQKAAEAEQALKAAKERAKTKPKNQVFKKQVKAATAAVKIAGEVVKAARPIMDRETAADLLAAVEAKQWQRVLDGVCEHRYETAEQKALRDRVLDAYAEAVCPGKRALNQKRFGALLYDLGLHPKNQHPAQRSRQRPPTPEQVLGPSLLTYDYEASALALAQRHLKYEADEDHKLSRRTYANEQVSIAWRNTYATQLAQLSLGREVELARLIIKKGHSGLPDGERAAARSRAAAAYQALVTERSEAWVAEQMDWKFWLKVLADRNDFGKKPCDGAALFLDVLKKRAAT